MPIRKTPDTARAEIIVHPLGWRTFLRAIVIADNQADALAILNAGYSDDVINEKRVIRFKVLYKPPVQQVLSLDI